MTEEIGAGVKILIERAKTNPQEIIEEHGRWGQLRDAVFNYKERKERSMWLRGLSEYEIDQLHEAFSVLYKDVFDSWVMKTVLEDDEKTKMEPYQNMAQGILGRGQRVAQGWTDPRQTWHMYQGAVSGAGGGGGGGSITTTASIQTNTAQRAEQLGLGHLLKKKLSKIKL